MNTKKIFLSVLAIFTSVCAFAYPALQDDDPVNPILQQYTAQIEELQKKFDQKLLPTVKSIAGFALEVQKSGQTDLTPAQEAQLEKYGQQLDKNLNELVAPELANFDLAAFNEQYAQMAKTYGLPPRTFTLPEVTDMFKGMCLVAAMNHFEQTKKLTDDELIVLMEIFFSEEEE